MNGVAFTSRDITFSSDPHEYRLPDGTRVPSVTEILKSTGIAVDFEEIAGISQGVAKAIDHKRDIGVALHTDAWSFDDDDLVWSSVDPRVEPYLRAWVTFRENTRLLPRTRERRVFHPTFGYAGTLDGVFIAPSGRLVLVDIKTGDPVDSGAAYQTAAYHAAYTLEHPDQVIPDRWAVQLMPGRLVPYVITPYTDWQDVLKFQAFVTTYFCQAARRRRVACRGGLNSVGSA